MKRFSFTNMINLGRNRNHYQGCELASNLRHIMPAPSYLNLVYRKHLKYANIA